MTCLETQGLITPFINDELNAEVLEEFLSHINQCESCKEELEVYYTLLTGMKLLDEERSFSNNFHLNLENKIKKAEERIVKKKISVLKKKLYLVIVIIFVGLFLNLGIEELVERDMFSDERNLEIKKHKLNDFFIENKNQYLSPFYFDKYQKIMYDIEEIKEESLHPLKGGKNGKEDRAY